MFHNVAALLDEEQRVLGLQLRGEVQSAQVQVAETPSQGEPHHILIISRCLWGPHEEHSCHQGHPSS